MQLVPTSWGHLREFNDCHLPAGSPEGGQFCSKGGGGGALSSYAQFEQQAFGNLQRTSRTAKGVSDTSASPDKPKLATEGESLKARANENFQKALQKVWAVKGHPLRSVQDVESLVTDLARTMNRGLLQRGQSLLRTWATKYKSTAPSDIPTAMQSFYREFHSRLQSGDPVETAAWVEKEHENIHPWADGVGRTTKALAYFALLRGGHRLPTYRGRDEYYRNITQSHAEWLKYYRGLF